MKFIFLETPIFVRYHKKYMDASEYEALRIALVDNPERGDVISNTGGFRKLQWLNHPCRESQHGGLRIIYYHLSIEQTQEQFIFFVTLYNNKESADLTSDQKLQMKRAITNEKFFRRGE